MNIYGSLLRFFYFLVISISVTACADQNHGTKPETLNQGSETVSDPHSFSNPHEAIIRHLDLNLSVDFEKKIITGIADFTIENFTGTDKIIFDTRDLSIEKIISGTDGKELPFKIGKEVPFLGNPLEIAILPATKKFSIYYSATEKAIALQWLSIEQTAGKKLPYLFTQSQSDFARTWIPCQDSPGIRFTYKAKVKVPPGFMAVMSAKNPVEKNPEGIYTFEMVQPIPAYLMALAVGDITFKPVGPRTGIYAEPDMIEKAAWEFEEMEKILAAAEKLYGPYEWERYDLLVLPPSFPFGGMENPRLTFATPTVITGDRSQVGLIAHELAHSWSGNLVTNATWNDIWLNEGFTTYFEKRIMEDLYGRDYSEMLALLGYQSLEAALGTLDTADTRLKLNLNGRDPDDSFTDIPYEKGYLFLRHIEECTGRSAFDAFLRKYFGENKFKSMTSEKFLIYLEKDLIKSDSVLRNKINAEEWIYRHGLPESFPVIRSTRLEKVKAETDKWLQGKATGSLDTSGWSTHEWVSFLNNLPETITPGRLGELDKAFKFTISTNSEILVTWLKHCIRVKYTAAYPALEKFLLSVGRRRYLEILYGELVKTPEGKKMAQSVYAKAKNGYHPVVTNVIGKILSEQ